EPVRSSITSDSMEISSWLPKETRSITEHLAIALREEIIDSGYDPGDRINPRLLSRRMRVPRASVDAALRRMVDDKLLDGSRGGARIPLITTVDVLDLYAARMAIGEVVLRSLSLRPQRYLVPVQLALRQVEAAAPTRSGIDVEDADLHFQQELARASGLRESARAFESLTLRLRLFISVLQLDYSPASDRIVSDDRAMFRSLARADARTAIEVWRGKVDNAVRHMAGLLGRRRFDQELWTQLTRSLESMPLRLRLLISVLQLDYSPASDRIVSDDRAMFRSLARADARTAIEVWRGKVDNAVRHMAGLLGRRRFDQELWTQLTRSL